MKKNNLILSVVLVVLGQVSCVAHEGCTGGCCSINNATTQKVSVASGANTENKPASKPVAAPKVPVASKASIAPAASAAPAATKAPVVFKASTATVARKEQAQPVQPTQGEVAQQKGVSTSGNVEKQSPALPEPTPEEMEEMIKELEKIFKEAAKDMEQKKEQKDNQGLDKK
jgi:hypothetical protein